MQFGEALDGHRRHHGAFHGGVRFQGMLDLAGFDPLAAHLHLMVDAAEILHCPIAPPAPQVAGAVEPSVRLEGIGDELLPGQLGPVDITSGNLRSAQVNLAGHANWRGQAVAVQHINGGVGDGPSDGNDISALPRRAGLPGDIDRRFGGAVQVVQPGPERPVQQPVEPFGQSRVQRLATGEDVTQPPQPPGVGPPVFEAGEEGGEHRRDEVQHRHAVTLDEFHQGQRVALGAGRRQGDGGAGKGPPEQLPHGDVESYRGLLQNDVSGADREGALHPQDAVQDRMLFHRHALRPAAGAGGEQHVGQPVRRAEIQRFGLAGFVEVEHAGGSTLHFGAALRRGQHEGMIEIFQHACQARRRVFLAERGIGRARHQDAVDGDEQIGRSRRANRDRLPGTDPGRDQPPRHRARTGREAPIVQWRAAAPEHGRGRGRRGDAIQQRANDRAASVQRRAGGIESLHDQRAFGIG